MAHVTIPLLLQIAGWGKTRKGRKRIIRLKPGRPSREVEMWYKSELLKIVKYLRKVTEAELRPILKQTTFQGDALPSSVAHQLNLLANRFGGIDATARRLAPQAVRRNLRATDTQLIKHAKEALGIDITPALTDDDIRDEFRLAEQANVDLITSIPTQYLEKLREGLEKNFAAGERFDDLTEFVEHVGDVTESRAKLIARDQTSKMNGAFNRVRQTSLGIKKYRWQTAGDERVRPTHVENDGKVFEWTNPPSETGNPGDDVNCRCVGIPEFDLDDWEE